MIDGRRALDEAMTERVFQDAVTEFAQLHGWLVYHTHDSRRSAPGFPDLTMVRNGRVVFAELKTERGRVTADQARFMEEVELNRSELASLIDWRVLVYDQRLQNRLYNALVAGHRNALKAFIWRPSDWPEVERELGHG